MHKLLLLLPFILCTIVQGQPTEPDPRYKLTGGHTVQAKNYYLLTLLQQDAAVRQLLESDTILTNIATNKLNGLSQAKTSCGTQALCYAALMQFTEQEISTVSARLTALYKSDNALGKLVQSHLIPSGTYILFKSSTPAAWLVKAWEQDARGINYAIAVYAAAQKPHYPNIDSISFNINAKGYSALLHHTGYTIAAGCARTRSFFMPSLTAALYLLEMNERMNAGDYEPMEEKENKAAVSRVRKMKWEQYPYSVILVPGAGPDEPATPLSADGMLRCRLAALQYQQGKAPFLVVSGGKVHPWKTIWCEAIEMKKFLMEQLHIPENAIIIEPHARHTTTNMRNCARLIFRYGIPFSKACLVTTTHEQSQMITTTLPARCKKELNEIPYKNGTRLSETDTEFFPLIDALHIDPTEPMDP